MPSRDEKEAGYDGPKADSVGRLIARLFLLCFMALWLFLMASCPGLYDSRTMAQAWKRHNDNPSEETRRGIEEARASDRRAILKQEAYAALVLLWMIFIYYQLSKPPKPDRSPLPVVREP